MTANSLPIIDTSRFRGPDRAALPDDRRRAAHIGEMREIDTQGLAAA